ncbi:peptidylprolyl isomerase [Pleionea sediminis]|uniref:peptidylprolyl isomerase n=1 Tax=Pleionea sediminis TaxID=2569479 RepID=UPI0011853F3D|nr:peptidylprolyl isomerase [Pleionea sediminis]
MTRTRAFLVLALLTITTLVDASDNPKVKFTTSYGDFIVELYPEKAPISVQNFLSYVSSKRYKDAHFYRVVTQKNQPDNEIKIEVVQGGLGWDPHPDRQASIKHEPTNQTGIKHTNGTISMARLEPGSADAEFFFCIGEQPELDYGGKRNPDGKGFAAFGKIIDGINTLQTIHQLKSKKQLLVNTVPIQIELVHNQ